MRVRYVGRFDGRPRDVTVLLPGACTHKYPFKHRIGDVSAGDAQYRVLRCVECGETWAESVKPELVRLDEPGVPIELDGPRLKDWVRDEDEWPLKDEPDWLAILEEG